MRRLEKVVLPEDEGPATRTMRASLERCITRLAISAMRCSWRASEIRISSLTRLAWMAVFNAPTFSMPRRMSQSLYSRKVASSFLESGSGRSSFGAWRRGKRSAKPSPIGVRANQRRYPVEGTMKPWW